MRGIFLREICHSGDLNKWYHVFFCCWSSGNGFEQLVIAIGFEPRRIILYNLFHHCCSQKGDGKNRRANSKNIREPKIRRRTNRIRPAWQPFVSHREEYYVPVETLYANHVFSNRIVKTRTSLRRVSVSAPLRRPALSSTAQPHLWRSRKRSRVTMILLKLHRWVFFLVLKYHH